MKRITATNVKAEKGRYCYKYIVTHESDTFNHTMKISPEMYNNEAVAMLEGLRWLSEYNDFISKI